jgi:hypothetical protein
MKDNWNKLNFNSRLMESQNESVNNLIEREAKTRVSVIDKVVNCYRLLNLKLSK